MLDGLDDIDWAALQHADGPAGDVPVHLRGLLAGSDEERRRARSGLHHGICHQGTRYEASAPAVPFLLELIEDPGTPDRAAIVDLVAAIAVGRHEAWLPGGFPAAELRAAAAGGRLSHGESPDDAQRQALAARVDLAAYDAVRAGQPVLRGLLADDDATIRAAAAFTLGWFPEDTPGPAGGAAANVAALTGAAADLSRSVAATALVALGLLGTAVPDALQDTKAEIRWGAAIALARLHGAGAGEEAAAELLHWAGGARTARAGIPFLGGDLAGYAALSLPALGGSYAAAALDALLTRLGTVTGVETLPVLGTALRAVFPAGPLPAGAALDASQRRLAGVLAGAPAAWRFDGHRSGDVASLLRAYGLPGDPAELRGLT